MSLPPDDWVEDVLESPAPEEANPVEWENPEWSSLPALLATLRRILLQPRSFFTNLPLTGGLGEPLSFALLVGTTGLLSYFLWQVVLDGGYSESIAVAQEMGDFMNDPKVIAGFFLLAPFLVALGQFFLSVCLTWAARLTGPGDTSFESVFRIAAYAQAPVVTGLIPWGGAFVAGIWNLVLLIIGLSRRLGLSTFKAAFTLVLATVFQGVLLLLFLLLLGVLGIWQILFS